MTDDLTHDAFLGGKLHLWQPRRGYRAGVDPVLLAAAIPAHAGQSVLELGCGVGTAILCLGARVPGLYLTGIERHAATAALATRNGQGTLQVVTADLSALPDAIRQQQFDHVLANPPYFDRASGRASTHDAREQAMGERTPLSDWVTVAAKRLAPKGHLHMIHRAERLPELLTHIAAHLGNVEVFPFAPRVGRSAELVIIRARKNGKGPFKLHPPCVMHQGAQHEQDGDDYVPEIRAVLRQGAALEFGQS